MGQHKIPGASKGPNYKAKQRIGSRFIRFHQAGSHPIGSVFKTIDGKKYKVAEDGSYRRLDV